MHATATADLAAQAGRFVWGVRRFLTAPPPGPAVALVAEETARRATRFLEAADAHIWAHARSPYRRLLLHAGIEPGDLRRLVTSDGLEPALMQLLDAGVGLTYEELSEAAPVRRGSLSFDLDPADLGNPLHRPDFIAGTSGSRSAGTPVPVSFAALRRMATTLALTDELWDVVEVPHALWRPALPSSGGLVAALAAAAGGAAPEQWFSPTDPSDHAISARKRLANRALPLVARSAGRPIPRPRYVPIDDPALVLRWCVDALARHGAATVNAYPSAAVALVRAASEAGTRLDGLVVRMVGEPVTAAKADALRSVGAVPVNAYAFAQLGVAGTSCPACADDEVHVLEHEVAVVSRRRLRPDGYPVDALAWTTLSVDSRIVLLNAENDDSGELVRRPCDCLLGQTGMRTRLLKVRGLTKSVAAGVTVPGDLLQRLVDEILPREIGGDPGHWQMVEAEDDGRTTLELRLDPGAGSVDEARVLPVFLAALRETDAGALAAGVWSSAGNVRFVRRRPVPTTAGKVLPYHVSDATTRS